MTEASYLQAPPREGDSISTSRDVLLRLALEANNVPPDAEPLLVVNLDTPDAREYNLRRNENIALYVYEDRDGELVYLREDFPTRLGAENRLGD